MKFEYPPGSGRVADYEPHEAAFMLAVAERYERGEIPAEEMKNQIEFLHEAKLMGGRLLTEGEEIERGYRTAVDGHGDFKIPAQAQLNLGGAGGVEGDVRQTPALSRRVQTGDENGISGQEVGLTAPPENLAHAARDEAIQRVDTAADPTWKHKAIAAVKTVAEQRDDLIADDVWGHLGEAPLEPRAMGPIMLACAKLGYIEATSEMREATRVVNHARPQRVWKSLLR